VADRHGGVQIVDIADPTRPHLVSQVETEFAEDVVVSGELVFVADRTGGMKVVATQCPEPLATFLSGFSASSDNGVVEVHWSVERETSGSEFRLLAFTDLDQWEVPFQRLSPGVYVAYDHESAAAVGGAKTAGDPVGVEAGNDEILYRLLHREPGREWRMLAEQVLSLQVRHTTALLEPYPNPAKGSLVIRYSLARAERVQITVHDVAGRVVARIFDGRLGPGVGQRVWSTTGGTDLKLASGVYVVRMESPQGVQSRKVVLLD
jgi:hypothetical protein